MENFVLGDEHQYRDAERTGLGCRDGQPDALDAQNHGQEDEGQQLEQQSAQEMSALVTPSPRAVKKDEP